MTTNDQADQKTELLKAPTGDETLLNPRGGHKAPAAAAHEEATQIAPRDRGRETLVNPRRSGEETVVLNNKSQRDGDSTAPVGSGGDTTGTYRPGAQGVKVGPGSVIKQRFVLEELLGVGGMGAVYRARDLRKEEAGDENSHIALKILSDEFRQHPKAFVTLQREAKKTQALAHPNIVTVYDFDREGDLVYLTMEELRGCQLTEVINGTGTEDYPALKQRIGLIRQIADGLAYAHSKGFVHSDLKPGNVMVTGEGVVKILDFGIARAAHEKSADSFDAGELGALTPRYASLEMINNEPPHPSDDIYALGIILCEILGGRHPYRDKDAAAALQEKLSPTLPAIRNPLLRGLVRQAVALERRQRIASAGVFLRRLAFAQTGLRRIALVASVCVAALAGNYAYIQTIEDTGVPFESLPIEQQAQFKTLMAQGRAALNLNILQDAVVFFDQAYAIHSTNDDLRKVIAQINKQVNDRLENAKTEQQRAFYQQQLLHLREYRAFNQAGRP